MKLRILIPCLAALLCPLPSRAQTDLGSSASAFHELPRVTLHIGKATLETEVAATVEQQERGLMFRAHLGDNAGMIFLLPTVTRATFWMKNTLLPLSIAFIDRNGVILEIHDMDPPDPAHPQADRDLPRLRSDSDQVAYALETNQHWFSLNGIKPGDKLDPAPGTLAPSATR